MWSFSKLLVLFGWIPEAEGCLGSSDGKASTSMQEIQVQYLGQEDPMEKGMATHSSVFAWRIPWTEEPGGLQSTGPQDQSQTLATNTA